MARSALVEVDDLAWDTVGTTPVDDDVLTCLLYMRDVEGFTDRDLTGAVAHPNTLADPLIVQFLSAWRAEERAHARAIDRYLTTYAERRGIELPPMQPPPPEVAAEYSRRKRSMAAAWAASSVCHTARNSRTIGSASVVLWAPMPTT